MFEDWLKSRKVNISSPMGRAVTTASVVGLHLVAAVFMGFGVGYFLDKFFGTAPWLTIIFLVLGVIAGFKNLISQGKKLMVYQEKMDEERRAAEIAANLAADAAEAAKQAGQNGDSPQGPGQNGAGGRSGSKDA